MTSEQLRDLHRLLSEWIRQPDWNQGSRAWAAIVETRRQIEIELWEEHKEAR